MGWGRCGIFVLLVLATGCAQRRTVEVPLARLDERAAQLDSRRPDLAATSEREAERGYVRYRFEGQPVPGQPVVARTRLSLRADGPERTRIRIRTVLRAQPEEDGPTYALRHRGLEGQVLAELLGGD